MALLKSLGFSDLLPGIIREIFLLVEIIEEIFRKKQEKRVKFAVDAKIPFQIRSLKNFPVLKYKDFLRNLSIYLVFYYRRNVIPLSYFLETS